MFNITHLEHVIYAVLMQLAIAIPTRNWWAGAAFASAFFIGREHAQREYAIGNPSTLMPWEGFDLWRWPSDPLLDLLLPIVAVVLLAYAMSRR